MKKRVALIWPEGLEPAHCLPLPFASIVSNTDPELCDFKLFDLAIGSPELKDLREAMAAFSPDIIGITSHAAMSFPAALSAVREARAGAPSAVVVAGGPHPSAWPRGVMKHAEIDFVIKGEAELAFGALVKELGSPAPDWKKVPGLVRRESGQVLEAPAAEVADLDSLALPDYRFIRLDEYLRRGYSLFTDGRPNAPIQTTRGCPENCAFCGVAPVSGHRVRHFSQAYVTGLIKTLHKDFGIQWFNIVDDNFTHDLAYAREFCENALKLGIPGLRFGTPNGIRMQRGDAALWRLMKQAGWEHLVVAPESGSDSVLKLMDKGLSSGEVGPILAEMRAAGLRLRGFFIVGYPGETPEDLERTLALIKRSRLDFVELLAFQPVPGTTAFARLLAAGEIDEDFIPSSFSSGRRAYVSPSLKDVNFPLLVLKVKLAAAARNPANFIRQLRRTDLRATARRMAGMISGIFRA